MTNCTSESGVIDKANGDDSLFPRNRWHPIRRFQFDPSPQKSVPRSALSTLEETILSLQLNWDLLGIIESS
jgi:hypothetical protein